MKLAVKDQHARVRFHRSVRNEISSTILEFGTENEWGGTEQGGDLQEILLNGFWVDGKQG